MILTLKGKKIGCNECLKMIDENIKLKEEIELKNYLEGRMNQLNSDYEELNILYRKQSKSMRFEIQENEKD